MRISQGAMRLPAAALVTVCCAIAFGANAPIARASSTPVSGSITVNAIDKAQLGGRQVNVACNITYKVTGATGMTITVDGATYDETLTTTTSAGESKTIVHDEVDPAEKVFQLGPGSLPRVYVSTDNGSVPAGSYGIGFFMPQSIKVRGTVTHTEPNQNPTTSEDVRYISCPSSSSVQLGIVLGKLNKNSTTVSGSQAIVEDWAGISGNPSGSTISWNLTDPALKGAGGTGILDGLKGSIKVTNSGIEATLGYKDFEISYSGDWKAAQTKPDTAPTITSPNQNISITIDQAPAAQSPSATVQSRLNGLHATHTSTKPFASGALRGLIATFTRQGSPDTWALVVVGNGQNNVTALLHIKPGAAPSDLLEAGAALGTISM